MRARPRADFELVASLFEAGFGDREIARRTGVPQSTVTRWHHAVEPPMTVRRADLAARWQIVDGVSYCYLLGAYLGDGTVCHQPPNHWSVRIINDRRYATISAEILDALETVFPGATARQWPRRSASPTSCTSPTRRSRGRFLSTARGASTTVRSSWSSGSGD